MKRLLTFITISLITTVGATPLFAEPTLAEVVKRMDALERENAELRQMVKQLLQKEKSKKLVKEVKIVKFDPNYDGPEEHVEETIERITDESGKEVEIRKEVEYIKKAVDDGVSVKTNHKYAFDMLDHTKDINQKQMTLLKYRQAGELGKGLTIGGSVTPIMNYQKSNTDSKFAYLMRHPTANNQLGKNVSEAVIHAAQFNLTGNLSDKLTAYAEFLYDPEQSFGAGTITALTRNQVQLRKGYLLYGDLDESPYYAAVGKMAVPFGLTDTVNPFTSSTVWHAFGGLSYGALMGYKKGRWNVSVDAVQGGAQFRAANVPVSGTSVPSRLNNLAFDVKYAKPYSESEELLVGASFIKGSAYCQGFPVVHFNPCTDHNPAFALYTKLQRGDTTYQAEWAQTFDEWPGTFNPNAPLNQFIASKVTSFQVGVVDKRKWNSKDIDLSLEFSRFVAGPDGAPWEQQDQWVLGVAHHVTPSVKLFGEIVRTEGYAPLNFISGGHIAATPNVTHSDRDAHSTIVILGADAAF